MAWTHDDDLCLNGVPWDVKRDTARIFEAQEHTQSIRDIPYDQFPDDEARAELVRRALRGEEVYAYQPVGGHEWVVWHYHGDPSEDCRQSPMEWARKWHESAGEVR